MWLMLSSLLVSPYVETCLGSTRPDICARTTKEHFTHQAVFQVVKAFSPLSLSPCHLSKPCGVVGCSRGLGVSLMLPQALNYPTCHPSTPLRESEGELAAGLTGWGNSSIRFYWRASWEFFVKAVWGESRKLHLPPELLWSKIGCRRGVMLGKGRVEPKDGNPNIFNLTR